MRLVARLRHRQDDRQERPGPVTPLPLRSTLIGTPGLDVTGVRSDGTAIEVAVAGGAAALLFLTGSCYGCRVLWEGAADGATPPSSIPTVIVTPSPTTEDARTVGALAPRNGIPVVMSSDVWHAYRVERAPWWVVVAAGAVVADGMAPGSWSELVDELARITAAGGGPAPA